ncbi:flavodoxin [bacterium]|nr:flavodoxin [bacterium]
MATAIIYGSSTGNTEKVAEMIKDELGDLIDDIKEISEVSADDMNSYDKLILGIPTWNDGELQEDWETFFEDEMDDVNFSGKTVAIFGLGDQEGYPEFFLDAMRAVYDKVTGDGGKVVGSWPTDGYEFDTSKAVVDGNFVGLAIDEDNQDDMTEERVEDWCDDIKESFE